MSKKQIREITRREALSIGEKTGQTHGNRGCVQGNIGLGLPPGTPTQAKAIHITGQPSTVP